MKLDLGHILSDAHWFWVRPPAEFDAPRKRGAALFDALRLQRIKTTIADSGGDVAVPHYSDRWTILVAPLPTADVTDILKGWANQRVCTIFDVHFPIMDMENAIGSDQAIIDIIDRKELLLANIALADAVTVPDPGWASDLAGAVGANVFYLPDLENDDDASVEDWARALTVIANSAIRNHRRRPTS